MSVKISLFAIDLPLPPDSGSRIDIYRRLKALRRGGFKIQLFVWLPFGTVKDPLEFAEVCEDVVFIQYRSDFSASSSTSKLAKLRVITAKLFSFTPAICNAMAISRDDLQTVASRLDAFAPDALVIDGIQCAHAVFQVFHEQLRPLPILYRSQNREFKYAYDQARNAKSLGHKLQFYCDALRFLYYEPYVMLRSSATLQISRHDYIFWSRLRMGKQVWLRPIVEAQGSFIDVPTVYDVVILGSWAESHKVAGLTWFLEQVKPLLPEHLKIAVAGRGASSDLEDRCRQSGCIFLGPVPDAHLVLAQGAVLLNPVFGGSGVFMKMLDMLRTGRPIVSTPDGVTGLDVFPTELVRIAENPQAFAQAILDSLNSPLDRRSVIAEYLDKYGEEACIHTFQECMEILGKT